MRPKVGDYVEIGPSNYNDRGDNLNMMRGYVSKVDDVFVYVKVDAYYRMRGVQRVMHGGVKVVKKQPRPPVEKRVEFEYQCTRKKCRHKQWVRGISSPEGGFIFGSQADFCDECQRMGMKHTGVIRGPGKDGALQVVEQTRIYDVGAHVACGHVGHYLWEVGASEGVQPSAFYGLTKLVGKGARVKVTMLVELLKPGKVTKPFHAKGCLCCNTHIAAKGKMHIALSDSTGFAPHNMKKNSGVFCGLLGSPSDWPKGNHWVSPTPGRIERADCKECLAAWDKKEEKRKAALRKDDKDGD